MFGSDDYYSTGYHSLVALVLDEFLVDHLMRDLMAKSHSPSAFLVYLQLYRATHAAGKETASASHFSLAQSTGLSKRSVQNAIAQLVDRRSIQQRRTSPMAAPGLSAADAAASQTSQRVTESSGYHRITMAAVSDVQIDDRQFMLISKAVADPKRFEMLQRIGDSDDAPTCSCLRDLIQVSPATITHHLKELENAGLIKVKREGKFARLTFRRDVWKAYLRRLSDL